MLRSDALMLDNTLIPLYQERVTSLTFTAEHTSEHLDTDERSDDDDDEESEESLVMTGVCRGAGKHVNGSGQEQNVHLIIIPGNHKT